METGMMANKSKMKTNRKDSTCTSLTCFMVLLVTLFIPVLFPHNISASPDWQAEITIQSGDASNRLVLGADSAATDGYDVTWDTYALMGGNIQAYFPHPEWGMAHQEFQRDIKAHNPSSTIEWSMTVYSTLTNAGFTISWGLNSLPESNSIVLIDDSNGQQTDMRSLSTYNFTYTGIRPFRIIVTESASCANGAVRIAGTTPVYYDTLQLAYNAADNYGDIIEIRNVLLAESLNINLDKSVTLKGGYDCNYSARSGSTTLNGTLTISNGSVSIEDFVVQ
jgi:hypothetical protein